MAHLVNLSSTPAFAEALARIPATADRDSPPIKVTLPGVRSMRVGSTNCMGANWPTLYANGHFITYAFQRFDTLSALAKMLQDSGGRGFIDLTVTIKKMLAWGSMELTEVGWQATETLECDGAINLASSPEFISALKHLRSVDALQSGANVSDVEATLPGVRSLYVAEADRINTLFANGFYIGVLNQGFGPPTALIKMLQDSRGTAYVDLTVKIQKFSGSPRVTRLWW